MSDIFNLLLEAEPYLKGNVTDGKADNNLARYISCSILEGRQAPWTTNMSLGRLEFLEKSCHSGCTGLTSRAERQGVCDFVPQEDFFSPKGISTGFACVQ
jgi:hypothetical protein